MNADSVSLRAALLLALALVSKAVRIANEYERGVLSRLGRRIALQGPGLFLIFPFGIATR
jgi:regulator of protease activity HflC (stomatin/prohibitin superfamily)